MNAYIVATGSYLPQHRISNEELAGRLGLSPEQIFRSSGIRQRWWAEPGTATSSLAAQALLCALHSARLDPQEIDYLILGTMTPDRFVPGSSPSVQRLAGLRQIPCLDIRATCCNPLYGMELASALIAAHRASCVALCLADLQSPWLDLAPDAGNVSMLFGDGASAMILAGHKQDQAIRIRDVFTATDGSHVDDLGVRCPGTEFGNRLKKEGPQPCDFRPRMAGQKVLLRARRSMMAACQTVLQRNQLTIEDVRWVVPHQANGNLLAYLARSLGLPHDGDQLVSVIESTANTSSASMGIALDSLRRSGRIRPGDTLLMPAFGAGFTWGAALCQA